jgi:hypothetical protein
MRSQLQKISLRLQVGAHPLYITAVRAL